MGFKTFQSFKPFKSFKTRTYHGGTNNRARRAFKSFNMFQSFKTLKIYGIDWNGLNQRLRSRLCVLGVSAVNPDFERTV